MDDRARVAELLGRTPQGAFDVVVRDATGDPVVVRNAPFLDDGTPMPTRYYLVGPRLVRDVSRLEAGGGVRAAEAAIDPDEIAATHLRYAAERDSAIDPGHTGPRPSGGVGGTRMGVKCLHAHVAHALAGGDDPVGRWALAQLDRDAEPTTDGASGVLTVTIHDRSVVVAMDGEEHELPIGPRSLIDLHLGASDPPAAMDLTNALGLVQDHLDDVVIVAPTFATPDHVVFTGTHATVVARVEIGAETIPDDYELTREAADEVFRMLAVEPVAERRHNPGLDDAHVESIIGACCVILGVMRRLDLRTVSVVPVPVVPVPVDVHSEVRR